MVVFVSQFFFSLVLIPIVCAFFILIENFLFLVTFVIQEVFYIFWNQQMRILCAITLSCLFNNTYYINSSQVYLRKQLNSFFLLQIVSLATLHVHYQFGCEHLSGRPSAQHIVHTRGNHATFLYLFTEEGLIQFQPARGADQPGVFSEPISKHSLINLPVPPDPDILSSELRASPVASSNNTFSLACRSSQEVTRPLIFWQLAWPVKSSLPTTCECLPSSREVSIIIFYLAHSIYKQSQH